MPSIYPDQNVGGITVVDALGNPTGAPGIINGYIPPSTFHVSCPLRYYGTDCTITRFDPTIINGLISEILCFATALNPSGAWDCNSVCNLAALFNAWKQSTAADGLIGIIDAEIAKWMRDHFDITDYISADRGVRITAAGVIQSDLGTGVRPTLT